MTLLIIFCVAVYLVSAYMSMFEISLDWEDHDYVDVIMMAIIGVLPVINTFWAMYLYNTRTETNS